jgi:hypothetical protein
VKIALLIILLLFGSVVGKTVGIDTRIQPLVCEKDEKGIFCQKSTIFSLSALNNKNEQKVINTSNQTILCSFCSKDLEPGKIDGRNVLAAIFLNKQLDEQLIVIIPIPVSIPVPSQLSGDTLVQWESLCKTVDYIERSLKTDSGQEGKLQLFISPILFGEEHLCHPETGMPPIAKQVHNCSRESIQSLQNRGWKVKLSNEGCCAYTPTKLCTGCPLK